MEAVNVRWVIVGCSLVAKCARPPRYVVRMLRGARPFPLPLALPFPARPVGAEWCPAFGPGFFMRGPALPRSPRAPLPIYVSVCVVWCVHLYVWWCPSFQLYRRSAGVGVRGPSVVLRPPRFGADAGCRPMCPALRRRPCSLCACGLGVRPRGHLAGHWPVRFKWPRARTPCPLANASARFRPTSSQKHMRFCHFQLANGIISR